MSAMISPGRSPARARRRTAAVMCVALTMWWTATASAQLDPLLFVKRVPPTVIIVVDTSMRMLEDGIGNYYDPNEYVVSDDPSVAAALNVSLANRYRRQYSALQYENVQDASSKFEAVNIRATPDTSPLYASFYNATRLVGSVIGTARSIGSI